MLQPSQSSTGQRYVEAVHQSIRTVKQEHAPTALHASSGQVPLQLNGSLYRNGPGRFERGEDRYRHLFDGDGMVSHFSFNKGTVTFQNRFVRTSAFDREEKARRLSQRSYGTRPRRRSLRASRPLHFKNTANTSLMRHHDKLLALWEGGFPYSLDPHTLKTRGLYDFEGSLKSTGHFHTALGLEPPFSAHPRRAHGDGRWWNFGMQLGPRPVLRLYREASGSKMREQRRIVLPEMTFVHDFMVTPHYCIFFLPSMSVDLASLLLGWTTPIEAMHSAAGPTKILLVPHDGGDLLWLDARPGFVYHFVNALEVQPDFLCIDAIRLDKFPAAHFTLHHESPLLQGKIPPGDVYRYTLDLRRCQVKSRRVVAGPVELPAINSRREGKPYRYFFAIGTGQRGRHSGLLKCDLMAGSTQRFDLWPLIPSEPVFVPDETSDREDAGWLLLLCFDARTGCSALLVLDAENLAQCALLPVPEAIPPTFHGLWWPGLTGT